MVVLMSIRLWWVLIMWKLFVKFILKIILRVGRVLESLMRLCLVSLKIGY